MIGIIDSGIGGLSVVRTLLQTHPNLSFVYHADSLYAPYGDKDFTFLNDRVNKVVLFLKKNYDINTLILACNTSSAVVFPQKKDHWKDLGITSIDIISAGIEAIKKRSKGQKNIGILATTATVKSGMYQQKLKDQGYTSFAVSCPLLVPLIESGTLEGNEITQTSTTYVQELFSLEPDIKTIILGCTHYPFILPTLQKVADVLHKNVEFVDPSQALLQNMKDTTISQGKQTFLTSGNTQTFNTLASSLLSKEVVSSHTLIE